MRKGLLLIALYSTINQFIIITFGDLKSIPLPVTSMSFRVESDNSVPSLPSLKIQQAIFSCDTYSPYIPHISFLRSEYQYSD